jgi:hypothetical protein
MTDFSENQECRPSAETLAETIKGLAFILTFLAILVPLFVGLDLWAGGIVLGTLIVVRVALKLYIAARRHEDQSPCITSTHTST